MDQANRRTSSQRCRLLFVGHSGRGWGDLRLGVMTGQPCSTRSALRPMCSARQLPRSASYFTCKLAPGRERRRSSSWHPSRRAAYLQLLTRARRCRRLLRAHHRPVVLPARWRSRRSGRPVRSTSMASTASRSRSPVGRAPSRPWAASSMERRPCSRGWKARAMPAAAGTRLPRLRPRAS